MKVSVCCPWCGKMVQVEHIHNATNVSGKFSSSCPACHYSFKLIVNKGVVNGSER